MADTYICDVYDDYMFSERHVYKPYLHTSGKLRVRATTQNILEDGSIDPDSEPYEYDMPGGGAYVNGVAPRAEFEDRASAIIAIVNFCNDHHNASIGNNN